MTSSVLAQQAKRTASSGVQGDWIKAFLARTLSLSIFILLERVKGEDERAGRIGSMVCRQEIDEKM